MGCSSYARYSNPSSQYFGLCDHLGHPIGDADNLTLSPDHDSDYETLVVHSVELPGVNDDTMEAPMPQLPKEDTIHNPNANDTDANANDAVITDDAVPPDQPIQVPIAETTGV